jgi:hypothetical protein
MKHILIYFLSLFMIFNIWSCDNFKSNELSNKELLELAEKCNTAGKSYFKEFQVSSNIPGTNYMWDEPEYHYNKRLNACLAHIRYIEIATPPFDDNSFSSQYNQTVDVFANKTILRGWFFRYIKNHAEKLMDSIDNVPNYTAVEYFKQKDKLFSE